MKAKYHLTNCVSHGIENGYKRKKNKQTPTVCLTDEIDIQRNQHMPSCLKMIHFRMCWWCFPVWPAGGAVVKRMAKETHNIGAVISQGGTCFEQKRKSRMTISFSLHHPDCVERKYCGMWQWGKEQVYTFSGTQYQLMRRWKNKSDREAWVTSWSSQVNDWLFDLKRVSCQSFCIYWLTAGWDRGGRGRRPRCTGIHRERRERLSGVVSLRGAVHCGNCVEVQWCCHGDELRRSVLEVGVTECESAYSTSTLIFTARATRQHLTRSRCLRATPTLSWQWGAGGCMQRKPFRESDREWLRDCQAQEEEGRI